MPARNSPELIAACYVLHRLSVPRHSPDALIALDLDLPSCTENKAGAKRRMTENRRQNAAASIRPTPHQPVPLHNFSHRYSYPCRCRTAPRQPRAPDLDQSTPWIDRVSTAWASSRQTASAVRIKKTSLHNAKEPEDGRQMSEDRCFPSNSFLSGTPLARAPL